MHLNTRESQNETDNKMDSDRRRSWTQPVAFLAIFSLFSAAGGSPLEVMSAPNLLRVESAENIFVEVQDNVQVADIPVKIKVMNHPTQTSILASTSMTLTRANNFQGFGTIKIPAEEFSKDHNKKQYVYLQAEFPNRLLEKVVLVSFQSGHIFIQTDKSIYTPGSNVFYRIFAVNPSMEPQTDTHIVVEIMNPEGLTVDYNTFQSRSGMISETFRLREIVSHGLWKVVAKFQSTPQQIFTAEFQVNDYVLPNLEVKLTPSSFFFYVDSDTLTVNIRARYVFGEEVEGSAVAVFGVLRDGDKTSFPSSLQRVSIENGNGVVTLTKEHISQTFPNIRDLVGSSMFVTVTVLRDNSDEMVEKELRDIKIVTSRYTMHFKKTPQFFKPGMTLDVTLEVMNPDKTPAPGVAVVVNPGNIKSLTTAEGIARLVINTPINVQTFTVTAMTDDSTLSSPKQASASLTALPYTTKSKSYLHITVNSAQVQLGESLRVNFLLNRQGSEQKDLTYLIFSRGQLVKHERYTTRGQSIVAVVLPITKEMLPSFRIVAYYHPTSDEVVADSVWVDVKDSCMGYQKLEPVRPIPFYEPRKIFPLKITGDPEAILGMVAVDKRVSVLNQNHQLTQKKIWDWVEEYDPGCTGGGGRDSMHVFYDAGLLFESSTVPGTPHRTELKCPASSRKKRATTIIQSNTTMNNQHTNKEQRECYLNGMKNIFASYTCEKQSKQLVNGSARVEAFMRCCQDMERQKVENKERIPLRSKRQAQDWDDDAYIDRNEIFSRSHFPESWLWTELSLSACPRNNPHCASTSLNKNVPLPDSVTTWQFTGISLSKTHGICVADPLEVTVRKEFFIDLRLPYSAVHGEQLEIKAIIYNTSPDLITVRVDLREEADVCSAAHKKHWYRQLVQVKAYTSQSVPFIIIPMKIGEFSIEVKAAVKDSHLSDGTIRRLRVVPKGELVNSTMKLTLDPASKGGKQVETINNEISATDLIPNTPISTSVYLKGGEQMSTLLENPISGESMGALIREPAGSGESNIAGMTLPVIATVYLDKTNQWETVGLEKRREAQQHIRTGYQKELAFRKNDGSFALFLNMNSATWLTAYVAKVFSLAYNIVAMDSNVICGAIRYLILSTQQPDGAFREVGNVFDKSMIGDVGGVDSDASMTAFCLIAMQESRTICSTTLLSPSISRAVTYLERRLPTLTNAYAVAMTSYALANEHKLNKRILYTFVAPDLSHWPVSKGGVYSLEATAYALLALVKGQALEDAEPVVRWLSQQQRTGGSYGSTQATIMVYQAVAEYYTNVREPLFALNVNISVPGMSRPQLINFNNENHHITRTIKLNRINKDTQVTATGKGKVMLQVVSHYYAQPSKQPGCELFDLNVELLQVKAEDFRTYKLRIQVLYKNTERNAAMSVLEIGLPEGYICNKNDLNSVSNRTNYIIAKNETDVSQRRSVIIHLNTVSNTRPEEISFRIQQTLVVKTMQPVAVSVYEYNNKKHCVKFYIPERESGKLLMHCLQDQCVCAEGKCCKQKTGQISNDERIAKACESTTTHKVDHVYKVRVESIFAGPDTDIYTMRILKVIKEGYDASARVGKLQSYLSFQHCRRVLNLKTGQNYLIMATVPQFQTTGNISALLDEDTWVEYWPMDEDCQTDDYRTTCLGLREMEEQMEMFGCEL